MVVILFILSIDKSMSLFKDFLDMRKKKKVPNTDRSIKLLLNKLNKYSIEEQKDMIERSIISGWTSVFPRDKKTNETKTDRYLREREELLKEIEENK